MNDLEKLELINTMEFIEDNADGETCDSVIVEDNKTNRDILYTIGFDNEYIEREDLIVDEGYLNVAPIAFKYFNWWTGDYFTDKEVDYEEMDCLKCTCNKESSCPDCCRDWDNEED